MPSHHVAASNRPGVSLRHVLLFCLALFAVHLAVDLFVPSNGALLPSGILILFEALLAGLACLFRARRTGGIARLLWIFTGCGELLIFISGIGSGLEFVVFHFPHNQTAPSDFLLFLWGLPIMLALGTPSESRTLPVFYWLDGVQITLLIVFAFLSVFGTLPVVHFQDAPIAGFSSTLAFSLELFGMAVAAALRWQTRPASRELRIFWASACLLLWLHATLDSLYNFINLYASAPPVHLQFLLAVPSLCIVLCATAPLDWGKRAARARWRRNLALFLDNGSPVLYPALVIVLAIACAFHHLRFSLVAIVLSLLAYALRSTVLQIRFQRIQLHMERTQAQLERLAHTDSLTGIANRREFDLRLKKTWEKASSSGQPFSLLVIDVDHFKMLNDTYGHAEGDRCLRSIAFALRSVFRSDNDLIARYGGEEFAAIICSGQPESVVSIARRMLRAVETLELRTETPEGNKVTISIGAAVSADADSPSSLLLRADQALYLAKHQGRNRIVAL